MIFIAIICVALFLVVLVFGGRVAKPENSQTSKKSNRLFSPDLSVREIVARINTGNDFKALLREQKNVERRMDRANEKTYDKLAEYSGKLAEAEN